MTTVYFFHGSHSSPKSTKIQHLKQIVLTKGWTVEIPDHSDIRSADDRVADMLSRDYPVDEKTILVGSSMGGYVGTILSQHIKPVGLFLLAPAFYIPNYQEQNPIPFTDNTAVIHGWHDAVVPLANSMRFARQHATSMHILDGYHNLHENIDMIADLFTIFIKDI